jgi:hypothetical protein
MSELELELVEQDETLQEEALVLCLLDLPAASLQIMLAGDIQPDVWERSQVEPKLAQNADGMWMLTVRRQGQYKSFDMAYIDSQVLYADGEMGLVVVLCAFHSVATYRIARKQEIAWKGQFYRYYRQETDGAWKQVIWRDLCDETRALILGLERPEWARVPGKLRSDRSKPTSPTALTSYKVVRVIEGRYYSLYDPSVEYVLGQRVMQKAQRKHQGGYFSYRDQEDAIDYLERCLRRMPFHPFHATPALALVECEIGGKIIDYVHKLCSTYLTPVKVLDVREVVEA